MAGILFIVAYGLWDSHHIKQIIRTSYSDTAVLAVTFAAALLLELDVAIFAGVLLSLLLYLRQTSNPQIHIRVPDPVNYSRKFTDTRAGFAGMPAGPADPHRRLAVFRRCEHLPGNAARLRGFRSPIASIS